TSAWTDGATASAGGTGPGNGIDESGAPDRAIEAPSVTKTTGGRTPSGEKATSVCHDVPAAVASVSAAKESAVSAGAGVLTGTGSRRNRAKGSATSSAEGVTRRRLSRNSGTRARTLRRNAIARAASTGSGAAALSCTAMYWSSTSGGQAADSG